MSNRVRILLVDDHPVVRDGLRTQIDTQDDLEVVAEAGSGEEALTILRRRVVDLLVTDLRMPGMGGTELVAAVTADYPETRVLVLTTYDSTAEVTAAVTAGAGGYVLKDTEREGFFRAIRDVARGLQAMSPSVRMRMAEPAIPALSAREVQVLALVAAGRTNHQIGAALFVGESTIKTHLQHIFAKLAVTDRAAAVAVAYRLHLLPDP